MDIAVMQSTEDELANQPPTVGGLRRSALVEAFAFLVPVLLADYLFFDGNRLAQVSPHPFWILVLLLSVQYGTREGVFGAGLSSFALLAGNWPAQSLTQDLYGHVFAVVGQPLLWFGTAVVLGELRTRHIRERDELRRNLREAQRRETAIAVSHEKMSAVKQKLEVRLASQLRSVITTCEAARAIEKLEPEAVLNGIMDVIRTVMSPAKFSFFVLRENALELHREEGWTPTDAFARAFYPESPIYREVIGRQRVLCCVDESEDAILDGQGVLAGPVFCAGTGRMVGMLKIEVTGFLNLNVSSVEAFKTLCEWFAETYANARRFQEVTAQSVQSTETQLYSYSFFQREIDFLTSLAKRFGFDLSLVVLRLENGDDLEAQQRAQIPGLLDRTVRKSLRRTDMVFDFKRAGFEFAFVLPGNSVENSQVLVDKLVADMKMKVRGARFSATCLALHQAHPEVGRFVQELFRPQQEILSNPVAH